MKAIAIIGGSGPAASLSLQEASDPIADMGEIVIRVMAAGVNRPDLLQRAGKYPPPEGASTTLGLEVAGEVVKPAGRWKAGDRVCALLGGGGYAEYAVCDARHALPIPAQLSFVEAAALPETVFTVYANAFEHGGLRRGDTLLVHGATSGIGTAAIQMAKAAGARVFATARGADKAATALMLGADIAVDTNSDDFGKIVAAAGGCDVVLDMVGGDYFSQNLTALRFGGRIVFIAAQAGAEAQVPIMQLMLKRAVVTGSTLRSRPADEKARLADEVETQVWPWIESGQLRPRIDRVFNLADAGAAHAYLEAGSHVGKVMLVTDAGQ